jgi:glucose/arabinose dehydrogenase
MFPRLRGRLLVSLHGYRGVGARIMAYEVDARGLPVIRPRSTYALFRGASAIRHRFPARGQTGLDLTPSWNAVAGVRPFGRPVGLSVAADGAIWVADDRNGTIIRIAADRP